MPTPSIAGVKYQVRIKWLLHGQSCLNVWTFNSVGVLDLITDLLEPILACIVDNLLPVLSDDLTLEGADFKNITGSVAQEGFVNQTTSNNGTVSGDSLPSTNAMVIALQTSHVGRSGKGRMFLPGIPESKQASSLVDATFIAAAVAFLACMFAAYRAADPPAAAQFIWVLHSRKDNQFYPITGGAPRNVVASMRSRKVGS